MKYKLSTYQIHELGQRQNQEDCMFPVYGSTNADNRIFILCDGMGGHEKGEVASSTVCEAMSNAILSRWNPSEPLSDGLLQQAIDEAFDALDAKDNGEEKKMGTTMTFVCFHAEGITVAHIGDSRIYQLRPAKGNEPARIVFQTRDHSLVNDLIKIGEITEEEAKTHPQKNVITRAMQPCQERRAKADIAHLTDIQDGDYFYMCSDGMLEQTTDDNLLFIITKSQNTDEQKVEMLRDVTSENKDNHTAHLIHVENVEGAPVVSLIDSKSCPTPKEPQGTFVTPEPEPDSYEVENMNSGSGVGLLGKVLIGAIPLALIAGGVYYFLSTKSDKFEELNDELVPVETVEPEEENEIDDSEITVDVDESVDEQKEDSTKNTNEKEKTTSVGKTSAAEVLNQESKENTSIKTDMSKITKSPFLLKGKQSEEKKEEKKQ